MLESPRTGNSLARLALGEHLHPPLELTDQRADAPEQALLSGDLGAVHVLEGRQLSAESLALQLEHAQRLAELRHIVLKLIELSANKVIAFSYSLLAQYTHEGRLADPRGTADLGYHHGTGGRGVAEPRRFAGRPA